MDNLRRKVSEFVLSIPEEYRAAWLSWAADLLDYLADLDARILDLRSSMRELSERITVVIHDAVRDASAGQELRIAALDEHVHAEVRTLTERVHAMHKQLTSIGLAIEAQIQQQDARHLQVLAELARLYDRFDLSQIRTGSHPPAQTPAGE